MEDETYHVTNIADYLRKYFGADKVHDKVREKCLPIRRGEDPCVIYAIFLVNNNVRIKVVDGKKMLSGVREGNASGRTSPRSMSPERRASPSRRPASLEDRMASMKVAADEDRPASMRVAASEDRAASLRRTSPVRRTPVASAGPAYAGGCNTGCGIGTPYRSMSPPRYGGGHWSSDKKTPMGYNGGNYGRSDYTGAGHQSKSNQTGGMRDTSPSRRLY